nr:MAG TPA: hypothetical protein [Bacteriophage sp.]
MLSQSRKPARNTYIRSTAAGSGKPSGNSAFLSRKPGRTPRSSLWQTAKSFGGWTS